MQEVEGHYIHLYMYTYIMCSKQDFYWQMIYNVQNIDNGHAWRYVHYKNLEILIYSGSKWMFCCQRFVRTIWRFKEKKFTQKRKVSLYMLALMTKESRVKFCSPHNIGDLEWLHTSSSGVLKASVRPKFIYSHPWRTFKLALLQTRCTPMLLAASVKVFVRA